MDNKRRQRLLELTDQFEGRVLERKKSDEREFKLKGFSIKSSERVRFDSQIERAGKAIGKLKRMLESDDWSYLAMDVPRMDSLDEDEKRNIGLFPDSLDMLIREMISSMEKKNVFAFSGYTKILIAYEMMFGFWNDSKKDELEDQLNLAKDVNKRSKDLLAKMSQGTAEVQMMIDRINSERNNLDELRNLVALKVGDVDNKAVQLAESIKKSQDDGDKLIRGINQKMNEVSANIEKAQTLVKQIESKLTETSRRSEETLKGVEDNLVESNSKVEDIKRMMGFIGGSVLGHSFNERKEKLSRKAFWWLVASLVFLVGAIIWICVVFTSLSAHTQIVWADIVINVVKSSLAVFAFGYALNEYGKERNLQEEYAFRESVALTLTAYLDQLGTCDEDEKKKLLVDTVEKLYTKPVISTKEYKMMQLDTKEIAEAMKPIAEIIKPLTDK